MNDLIVNHRSLANYNEWQTTSVIVYFLYIYSLFIHTGTLARHIVYTDVY